MDFNDPLVAVFVFLIGACVGSFLNVVVYRMPLGQSLVTPPSACPNCKHHLAWFDNIPVLGWLWLRGKCRYCKNPISVRYPIVELITGLLFLGHYLLLFHAGWGPYAAFEVPTVFGVMRPVTVVPVFQADYPIFLLHLWLIAALLAASLIDLEHYIIPLELCWITAGVGLVGHTLGLGPRHLGSLHFGPVVEAMTLAAAVGVAFSIAAVHFKWLRRSFEDDAPLLEKDIVMLPEAERPDPWTPARIRAEMRREMLYLLPALILALIAAALLTYVPAAGRWWMPIASNWHASAFLGSLCGGLVGAAVVWLFRIGGSYGFGREAMGLGDVHLMLAVGCVLGPGAATAAFFIAPAAGLAVALVQLFMNGRREIPYGPYLSLAAYAMMLFYTPIYNYFGQGLSGLGAAATTFTGSTP